MGSEQGQVSLADNQKTDNLSNGIKRKFNLVIQVKQKPNVESSSPSLKSTAPPPPPIKIVNAKLCPANIVRPNNSIDNSQASSKVQTNTKVVRTKIVPTNFVRRLSKDQSTPIKIVTPKMILINNDDPKFYSPILTVAEKKAKRRNSLLEKRLSQFPNSGLVVKDQNLFCSACDKSIQFLDKEKVKNHLQSKLHKQIVLNKATEELKERNRNPEEIELDKLIDKRIAQYPNQGLVKRGQCVYCSICDHPIAKIENKKRLDEHIKTKTHLRLFELKTKELSSSSTQTGTGTGTLIFPTERIITPDEINRATILMFHKMKVSLEKMDHPAFIDFKSKYITCGSKIVKANQARRNLKHYLNEDANKQQQQQPQSNSTNELPSFKSSFDIND